MFAVKSMDNARRVPAAVLSSGLSNDGVRSECRYARTGMLLIPRVFGSGAIGSGVSARHE